MLILLRLQLRQATEATLCSSNITLSTQSSPQTLSMDIMYDLWKDPLHASPSYPWAIHTHTVVSCHNQLLPFPQLLLDGLHLPALLRFPNQYAYSSSQENG
jgi:hypothetical protein